MKTAVVLFNLGGPDELKAVRPFLFRLFNDKAVIQLPQPLRFICAMGFSILRTKKAKNIYQQMGGKSPILDLTMKQATALEERLRGKGDYKVFVSMRYSNPMSDAVIKNLKNYAPDHIIFLPLYPQYSTTTTGSSFADFEKRAYNLGLKAPVSKICCFPTEFNFVAAHAKLIRDSYWKASEYGKPRILFSAHGLPLKIIDGGDPYQMQVEKTVSSILQVLAMDDVDHRVCYQSKVGPLEWLGPSTQDEIMKAGRDGVPVLIVPIAFVSEHSETLVELDVDFRQLAGRYKVPGYVRVPALGTEPHFIEGLAELCEKHGRIPGISSHTGERFCPRNFEKCPCFG
jgi:ferrochelatase